MDSGSSTFWSSALATDLDSPITTSFDRDGPKSSFASTSTSTSTAASESLLPNKAAGEVYGGISVSSRVTEST